MSVGLFLIVALGTSASQASKNADTFSWEDIEIKINSLLANQKHEIESKFNNLLSERGRAIEDKYDSLLRNHLSLEQKFELMDRLTSGLRNQNEKLQKQVLELENTVRKLDKNGKYNRRKTTKKPKNSLKGNLMASILTHNEELPVNQTSVAKQQLPGQRITRPGTKPTQNNKSKRLLLPVTNKPPTTPTIPTHARVAFHARLSKHLVNPGDNQHLDFSNVLTNVGNGYHSGSSTFICPVSGTYVFFLTMLSFPDKYLETGIVLNGSQLVAVYTYNDHYYNSGSNMVILDLKENDEVWVSVSGGEHHTGTVAADYWSTFSGFILWPSL